MASEQEILNRRKQALLAELESIKDLLNSDNQGNIPVLKDAIIETVIEEEKNQENNHEALDILSEKQDTLPNEQIKAPKILSEAVATSPQSTADNTNDDTFIEDVEIFLEDEMRNNTPKNHKETVYSNNPTVLPGQQSLFKEVDSSKTNNDKPAPPAQEVPEKKLASAQSDKNASLSQNPFLPPHVRQRFENKLKEAEDNSTEPVTKQSYTERVVDEIIAHHMPKIEEDLRKRLTAVVKLHNERLKK